METLGMLSFEEIEERIFSRKTKIVKVYKISEDRNLLIFTDGTQANCTSQTFDSFPVKFFNL